MAQDRSSHDAGAPVPEALTSITRSLELLWQGRPQPTRGRKPTLELAQIIDAAIAVADAEGIDALSMRRIAQALDVGTMSLYRYVPNKSVLLNLVLDRLLTPVEDGQRSDRSWRETLEADAWESRELYLRHPWVLQVNWSRPVLGPGNFAGLERTMKGLQGLPLSDKEKVMVVSALDAYVTGAVRNQVLYQLAAEEDGLSEERFWSAQSAAIEAALTSRAFPVLAEIDADAFDASWEETFELGLSSLLNGIATELARREDATDSDP